MFSHNRTRTVSEVKRIQKNFFFAGDSFHGTKVRQVRVSPAHFRCILPIAGVIWVRNSRKMRVPPATARECSEQSLNKQIFLARKPGCGCTQASTTSPSLWAAQRTIGDDSTSDHALRQKTKRASTYLIQSTKPRYFKYLKQIYVC